MPHSLFSRWKGQTAIALCLGLLGLGWVLPKSVAAPSPAALQTPLVFQLRMQATINSLDDRLEISESRPLSFGSFLPLSSGSITITPEGSAVFGGEFARHSAFHEGDHQAGELELIGLADQPVHFEISADGVLEGPGETMAISGIVLVDTQGKPLTNGSSLRFDASGQTLLRYGATLHFAEAQEPGVYTGETQITMNY